MSLVLSVTGNREECPLKKITYLLVPDWQTKFESVIFFPCLRNNEQGNAFAGHGADEDDGEGEDVGDDEHQLLEPLHPRLGRLRSRVDVWRFNLRECDIFYH